MEELQSYDWPGNVRELQNIIERGVILAKGGKLQFDLPRGVGVYGPAAPPASLDGNVKLSLDELAVRERDIVAAALRRTELENLWRRRGRSLVAGEADDARFKNEATEHPKGEHLNNYHLCHASQPLINFFTVGVRRVRL